MRSPTREDARALASRGARVIPGDLDDAGALADLARGADAFIHLAAHVGDTGTPQEFERVNVRGTLAAIEGAAAAGVRCFVHLSSATSCSAPTASFAHQARRRSHPSSSSSSRAM